MSGAPHVPNMVQCEEMGLEFVCTRSASGKWYGSWQDICLGCSRYDIQVADWAGCCEIAIVNFVGEYPWQMGEYGAKWLLTLSVKNESGMHCRDWIQFTGAIERCSQLHIEVIVRIGEPLNKSLRSAYLEWHRHSRQSSTRWLIGLITNFLTYCMWEMQISPRRIWTPGFTSQRTDGVSTLLYILPQYPEQSHQAMANSHTVYGVLRCLFNLIRTRQTMANAGELWSMLELDWNFKSQQHGDSIHSLTCVTRWCGCF